MTDESTIDGVEYDGTRVEVRSGEVVVEDGSWNRLPTGPGQWLHVGGLEGWRRYLDRMAEAGHFVSLPGYPPGILFRDEVPSAVIEWRRVQS